MEEKIVKEKSRFYQFTSKTLKKAMLNMVWR